MLSTLMAVDQCWVWPANKDVLKCNSLQTLTINAAPPENEGKFWQVQTVQHRQLCEKVGKKLGLQISKKTGINVGKQKEKVRIKLHICGTLKYAPFSNSRRFEVCGVL